MTLPMPQDKDSAKMQLVPAKAALASTYNSSLSSQVEVTLNTDTSFIEVHAFNTPILMKYKTVAGGTAVSTSSFDECIDPGSTRNYAIPSIGGVKVAVLAFIELSASAALVLIEK